VAVVLVKRGWRALRGWYSFERMMLLILVFMYLAGFREIREESRNRADAVAAETEKRAAAIRAENRERRDQACAISERKQASDILKLERTYAYLLRQPREAFEEKNSLPSEVVRALPQSEEEARTDDAPPFCDEPGIGLREPDMKVPARPAKFR
jgi:hypothetical protein